MVQLCSKVCSNAYCFRKEAQKSRPSVSNYDIDCGGKYIIIVDLGGGYFSRCVDIFDISLLNKTETEIATKLSPFDECHHSIFSATGCFFKPQAKALLYHKQMSNMSLTIGFGTILEFFNVTQGFVIEERDFFNISTMPDIWGALETSFSMKSGRKKYF